MNIPTGNRNSLSPLSIKNFVNESRNGPDLEGLTETSQQIEIKWVWNFKGNANKWSGIVQVRPIWSVCFNETVGRKEGWGRKNRNERCRRSKDDRILLDLCVQRRLEKNEAKWGEESWPTVASGSGPSLSKSSPDCSSLSAPLHAFSSSSHAALKSLFLSVSKALAWLLCALLSIFTRLLFLFSFTLCPRPCFTRIDNDYQKSLQTFSKWNKVKMKMLGFYFESFLDRFESDIFDVKKKKKEKQLLSYFFGKIICKTLCVRALLTFTFFQLS